MRHAFIFICSLLLCAQLTACPRGSRAEAEASSAPVNLNQADAETLQRGLTGIGATKARAIVAWRAQHGRFSSLDELTEVKGIGPALLAKNRARIRL